MAPRPRYSRRPSHDLFECIEQSEYKHLSENQARRVFAQIVEAVYYLHSIGVVHRDIKDENIVIDKDLKVVPSLIYSHYSVLNSSAGQAH